MSKARSMYAGSSGMVNGTNAMCVQIGDKLQGLPPTTNKPAQLINHITTKAEGDKRDYIFCINQLAGGVGKGKGQFATSADGVKNCTTGKYAAFDHCSTTFNMEALNEWVRTDLSSLFATMDQGAGNIVTNMSQAYGYFGLAVVPKALIASNNIYAAVASGGTTKGTLISWILRIDALLNATTTLASVTNNSRIPLLSLMEFINNGASALTTITSLNADFNNCPLANSASLSDFRDALQTSIDSNPDAKDTLTKLFGKDIKVPGSNQPHALVAHIFPESFIKHSPLFHNMEAWLTNAITAGDRLAPNIWHAYDFSIGRHNGLTYAINSRDNTIPQYRTNFIDTCDTSVFAIPGSSDVNIPGSHDHQNGVFVPGDLITSITPAVLTE